MANSTLVEVLNTTDKLQVNFGSLLLIKTSISNDKAEKLAAFSMLRYHKIMIIIFDNLVELYDVRMTDFL